MILCQTDSIASIGIAPTDTSHCPAGTNKVVGLVSVMSAIAL